MRTFPFYKQLDSMDCGPACLQMICKHYGKYYALNTLRAMTGITKAGVSLYAISEAAEQIGFRTLSVKTSFDIIEQEAILPLIAHWDQNHFLIVYKISRSYVYVADPGKALIRYKKEEFLQKWVNTLENGVSNGVALLMEPTVLFFNAKAEERKGLDFYILFKYLGKYKRLVFQLLFGLLLVSLLSILAPFLTQAIIDIGIDTRNIQFIYLILLAQLFLYFGQTAAEFVRNWILLHINTRISISIQSDFLIKLMKLPISFFDSKRVSDILLRLSDQQRIQTFLTGPALNTLFSLFNFIIFSVIIIAYNFKLFFIFIGGSLLYVLWIIAFLKHRKKLDYSRFDLSSQSQNYLIQLIYGMQEIKMNNAQTTKRWQWEKLQVKSFKLNVKSLKLGQYQQGGAVLINQTKNLFITCFSAAAVVKGQLTLGGMLAIQYVVGQLNNPIEQFIQFIQIAQDALISMERMNEIHTLDDEEPADDPKIAYVSGNNSVVLKEVCFKYTGSGNSLALSNINLLIPFGKTTAIVGESGSGKTTLLKLLMKYYAPTQGRIDVGDCNLQDLSNKTWRSKCGVVLQDSYIFSETIANNITVGDEDPDLDRLAHAVNVANIGEFIRSLPLRLNTRIGSDGMGISQGQRQRILIARSVYKNPDFIFFDEATNSLDANNESIIIDNLRTFFEGRTVVVAAHRLSTIRHAGQIVVLDKGMIVEKGTHEKLVSLHGHYFKLVKNQLEPGIISN